MYHIWKYNQRRTGMFMLSRMEYIDKAGMSYQPASWNTRQGAQKYGVSRFGKGNFRVLECEGSECGMKQAHNGMDSTYD